MQINKDSFKARANNIFNQLVSSFIDGYIYDITSNYSIKNRLIGNYIYQ